MKLIKSFVAPIIICLLSASSLQAQYIDDTELRSHVSAEYKFNKKLSAEGTYYIYFNNNISSYNKSVLAGEVGYKITKWLKAELEYRYGMSSDENYNEIRYSLTFSHKFPNNIKIKYRPMLNQEFESLKKDENEKVKMKYYVRNRLTVGYELNKKMELFVSTENYQQIKNSDWRFNRQKSAVGAKWDLNKQNSFSTTLYLINKRKDKNIARIDVGYTYTFKTRTSK